MNNKLVQQYIDQNFLIESEKYGVDSMYVAEKTSGGEPTGETSVVYTVRHKQPIDQIPEDKLIPSSVKVGDDHIRTDVIQADIEYEFENYCHDINDQTGARIISRNRRLVKLGGTYDISRRPGLSCMNLTHSIQYKKSHSPDEMFNGILIGTVGFFAVDNQDGNLVAVSNNHVFTPGFISADEQGNNPVNYQGHAIVTPADDQTISGTQITPGYMTSQERTIVDDIEYKLGEVKRSYPLRRLNNEVDAAICSCTIDINNDDPTHLGIKVNEGSSSKRGNSWIPVGMNIDYNMKWATTNEIDSIIVSENKLFKTGWATGAVGSPVMNPDRQCELFMSGSSFSGFVSGRQFKNVIQYKGRTGLDPSAGGDSGSPVCALINGEWKIIGIHFAGGRDRRTGEHHALACRIDKIAEKLNIKRWDGRNAKRSSQIHHSVTPEPTYAVLPGHTKQATIIIDGKTYYQVGRTDREISHRLSTLGEDIAVPH